MAQTGIEPLLTKGGSAAVFRQGRHVLEAGHGGKQTSQHCAATEVSMVVHAEGLRRVRSVEARS